MGFPLATLCGQLLVGGFDGTTLPPRYARALRTGARGGAILFHRNVADGVYAVADLNRALGQHAPPDLPPLIAVDQEGGRVYRLGRPALSVPTMRRIGNLNDVEFASRLGKAQGAELAALGFTMNFAPVLDVDSNPANPIIGDRSFSADADDVSRIGVSYALGLETGGVLACGKHFPGHGDTSTDSHLVRPIVTHDRARLEAVELAPFRAAIRAGIAALMTAHVVYPALHPGVPATLSRVICTELLRDQLGFRGLLVSDDLEMGSIKGGMGVGEAAVQSVLAGCDVLLVCLNEEAQDTAYEALCREASQSPAFAARVAESAARSIAARVRKPPRPHDRRDLEARSFGAESLAMADEIEERLGCTSDVETRA